MGTILQSVLALLICHSHEMRQLAFFNKKVLDQFLLFKKNKQKVAEFMCLLNQTFLV